MNKFFLCSALFYGASASCPDGFSSSGDGYCTPTLGGRTQDGPGENTMCRNAQPGNGNGQTKWYNDVAPADCKAACDSTTDCQAYSAAIDNRCLLHWPAGATSPPASFADTILGPIPVSSAWCYFYPNTFTSCDYMQHNSPLTGYVYQFGWSCHIKDGNAGNAAASYEGAGNGRSDGWGSGENGNGKLHPNHAHVQFNPDQCANCDVVYNPHGTPKMKMYWLKTDHPNGFTCQFDQTTAGGAGSCDQHVGDCTCTCYCGADGPNADNNAGEIRYNYHNQPDKARIFGDMSASVNGPPVDRVDKITTRPLGFPQ